MSHQHASPHQPRHSLRCIPPAVHRRFDHRQPTRQPTVVTIACACAAGVAHQAGTVRIVVVVVFGVWGVGAWGLGCGVSGLVFLDWGFVLLDCVATRCGDLVGPCRQTCPDLPKLVQTGQYLPRLSQSCCTVCPHTCTDLPRLAKTCTGLRILTETCQNRSHTHRLVLVTRLPVACDRRLDLVTRLRVACDLRLDY